MMVDRVFTSIPFSRDMVAKVCPYSIIRTKTETLVAQGDSDLSLFFFHLFSLKKALLEARSERRR